MRHTILDRTTVVVMARPTPHDQCSRLVARNWQVSIKERVRSLAPPPSGRINAGPPRGEVWLPEHVNG